MNIELPPKLLSKLDELIAAVNRLAQAIEEVPIDFDLDTTVHPLHVVIQ